MMGVFQEVRLRWIIERIGAAQAQDVQLAVQYATFKQVAELQKAMTAQLFQSLGIGQNVDLEA